MSFSNHEQHSLVAVKLSISPAHAHGECSVIDRQKRWSVLLSVRCPPTAFPAANRLEDGNVGKFLLEKQL
jgi:hypothetical protein